jgi:hypothetical protein
MAIASPIPDDAPVIKTFFPASFGMYESAPRGNDNYSVQKLA